MTSLIRGVALLLLLVCFASAASAQTVTSTTGAINGTVTDGLWKCVAVPVGHHAAAHRAGGHQARVVITCSPESGF